MRSIFGFLIGILLVACAVPLIPLSTVVDTLRLKKFGFEAAQIEGNIWSGMMYDAYLAKVPLGDITSKMSLADLTKGRLRLEITGTDEVSRLKGAFSYGLGGLGIENLSLGMPVMAGPPPIGGVTLIFDGLHAQFPGGVCTDGGGEVRAYLNGALPIVGLPSEMSGPALCRDGLLAFSLESPSGREQQEVTILSAQRIKMRVFVKPQSPEVREALIGKGFRPEFDGLVFQEERGF